MKIHPGAVMRQAEQELISRGAASSDSLMDSAIAECCALLNRDPQYKGVVRRMSAALIYAGKGKNAGDAIGLARELGFERILLRRAEPHTPFAPETQRQIQLTQQLTECPAAPPLPAAAEGYLIIDGLLGSGARGELTQAYAELVEEANTLRAATPYSLTLAVDMPTGLQATGGEAVRADATLSIGCVKPELLADGAEDYVGRLLCVPLPGAELPASTTHALDDEALNWLPRRPPSCYKNRAGRVCIIAGSPGYTGAAQMCAEAALAAGAGLVELYCLPQIYPTLAARVVPEVMVRPIASYAEVDATHASALLIGPGLGSPTGAEDLHALKALVEQPPCPLVLDADGLNLTAAQGWSISPKAILTPHPGEMRRLYPESAGLPRAECAIRFVNKYHCTLLLKGARTIIANTSSLFYNTTGGSYMANGGQGDVLSGVIAALAAQGLPGLKAAALGAYLCGRAATAAHAAAGFPLAVSATRLLPHLTALNFPNPEV